MNSEDLVFGDYRRTDGRRRRRRRRSSLSRFVVGRSKKKLDESINGEAPRRRGEHIVGFFHLSFSLSLFFSLARVYSSRFLSLSLSFSLSKARALIIMFIPVTTRIPLLRKL